MKHLRPFLLNQINELNSKKNKIISGIEDDVKDILTELTDKNLYCYISFENCIDHNQHSICLCVDIFSNETDDITNNNFFTVGEIYPTIKRLISYIKEYKLKLTVFDSDNRIEFDKFAKRNKSVEFFVITIMIS